MGPDARGQNMRGKDMRDKRKDTAGPVKKLRGLGQQSPLKIISGDVLELICTHLEDYCPW